MEIRKTSISTSTVIVLTLISLGFFMRLLPHVPNVAPVGAIALFGGAILAWRVAVWLPLVIMISSDLVIGFYQGIEFTWAAFFVVALYGMLFRHASMRTRVFAGSIGGATLFFLVSNFGTWLASGMYPHTAAGLATCFVAALPFFKATLLGDVIFSAVLFGAYEYAFREVRLRRATHAVSSQ